MLCGRTALAASDLSLEHAAESYVREHFAAGGAHYFVTAEPASSAMLPCSGALTAYTANTTEHNSVVTVALDCAQAEPWTARVSVHVEVETAILVLRRALPRRAPIKPKDVELQIRRVQGTLGDYVTDIGSLSGHRLNRSAPAGMALTVKMLMPNIGLRPGQRLTVLAATSPGMRLGPPDLT